MRIPLFPLHAVLSPGIAIPIHVFEERYRVMVRRCLDTSSPFGVVLIREGSEVAPPAGQLRQLAIAGVGTFAEIREASRRADGRWDLLAVGTGRFLVRDVHPDAEPYLVADVDSFPDEVGHFAEAEALVGRVSRRFVDYLRLLQPQDGETPDRLEIRVEVEVDPEAEAADLAGADSAGRDPESAAPPAAAGAGLRIPEDPSTLSFLLAGIVQVELDRKQALLEASTAEDRLRDLDRLLDREIVLLGQRLAALSVDPRQLAGHVN